MITPTEGFQLLNDAKWSMGRYQRPWIDRQFQQLETLALNLAAAVKWGKDSSEEELAIWNSEKVQAAIAKVKADPDYSTPTPFATRTKSGKLSSRWTRLSREKKFGSSPKAA